MPGYSRRRILAIEPWPGQNTNAFDGLVDDVGIFSAFLTDNEINSIMKGGLSSTALAVSPKEGLAAIWGRLKQ